jgi:hypothetical protein
VDTRLPVTGSWGRKQFRTRGYSARLDLAPRVFEVEVPLDAPPYLIADTSFAPEPQERCAFGTDPQRVPDWLRSR